MIATPLRHPDAVSALQHVLHLMDAQRMQRRRQWAERAACGAMVVGLLLWGWR